MTQLKASTQFINVLVKVTGTAPDYKVVTAPAIPYVTQADTIINYQLYDTGKQDIVFTGVDIEPNDELAYSISVSKKMLTISDANTVPGSYNMTFELQDESGYKFNHDPQVRNEPEV
jgi:hypothetical protein